MGGTLRIISLSRRALVSIAAATVVTTLLAPAASAAADCTVEYLPVQNGADWSSLRITGVDRWGNVSGFYSPNRDDHTLARWTADGMQIVPRPEGAKKFVTRAANASGVVAASVDRTDGTTVAMTHSPGAGYRELPTPAGYQVWGVEDINDRGDVLGRVQPAGTSSWGGLVVWHADGHAPDIIELPGINGIALGEDGTVLVDSWDGASLWRGGALAKKLPDLGSSVDPRALTRDGVIFSSPYGEDVGSWLWTESTGVVERFSGNGVVEAANQDGRSVGYLKDGNYTAVVWQGTTLVGALPLPQGVTSGSAEAVGESGVIAGIAGTKAARWICR
ncbi:hypothetical protein [Lentzea sp. NPDC051838]|uniref:hypothetical protein n=1 Tax=Lentzea sp. NPDC051838 TaxID=3154849 RepID=UPI00344AF24F